MATYEWQKSIWKIGTKFGRNSSEFIIVYIEDGVLYIGYTKMVGPVFKTTSSYILNQQWNQLMETLRESTKFAVWYYDFLFNYLLNFTITLITGGLSALAKEIAEEIAFEIASSVIDSPTIMAAPLLLAAHPGAANRGLPTGKTDAAFIVPDGVPKFDRGVPTVDVPTISARNIDPPQNRVDDVPARRVADPISDEALPPPVNWSDKGLSADGAQVARTTDDTVKVEGPPSADTLKVETTTPITSADRGLPDAKAPARPSQADMSSNPDVVTAANLSAKSDEFIDANPDIPVMVFRYDAKMAASPSTANWGRFNVQWAQSSGVPMRVSPNKPLTGLTPRHPHDSRDRKRARRYMDKQGASREGKQAMHTIDGIINPFVDATTSTGTTFYFGNEMVNSAFGNQARLEIKRLGLKAGDQVVIRFEGFPDYTAARPTAPPASPPNLGQ